MIYFRNGVRGGGVNTRRLKADARTLLVAAGQGSSSLSITLVSDREIAALNRQHRGKNRPTDVLSFPLHPHAGPALGEGGPERLLGDVVISIDTARRQAAEYQAPLQNEVNRLLIHGILHVLGYDHEESAERAIMEAEERRLAAAIGMPWPYENHA